MKLINLKAPRDTIVGITQHYWYNSEIHRLNRPAVIYGNGSKYWYQNNQLHRTDGPAIEYSNGDKVWYQKGKLHRLDGPALEIGRSKEWFVNGVIYKI